MKNNIDIKFSYYVGNIYKSEAVGIVDLEYFIYSIKNPKKHIVDILKRVEQASKDGDLKLKRSLKHKLYAFTPTVMIETGFRRNYENILYWTGLMQLDFDGLENKTEAKLMKKHIFENNKQIVCAFISPSGRGIKCLMRTIIPKGKEHYKALHKGMVNHFEQYSYLDLATKNAVLPLFLSFDEDILYRDFSECEEWHEEDWTKPEYVQLIETNPTSMNAIKNNEDYYYNKVVRIAETNISNILDNGHPQVRSVSLILGSRVSAGYINKSDAESLIIHLISNNSYLNKNTKGYINTAMWAINQGLKSPRYFKN
jgi:hypothetical protein